jgi:hypothetical protein
MNSAKAGSARTKATSKKQEARKKYVVQGQWPILSLRTSRTTDNKVGQEGGKDEARTGQKR